MAPIPWRQNHERRPVEPNSWFEWPESTTRHLIDRLILSPGRLNVVAFGFFRNLIEQGVPERNI